MAHPPGITLKPLVRLGRTPEACWQWLGPKTANGHGKKTFAGRETLAHRWLWEQLFGPIPDGLVVYHTCDSKDCCNPHHLACGFMADAVRGSVAAKLLPADVIEIRAARRDGSPHLARRLADRYGVSPQTIRDIWRRDSWGARRRHRAPNQQHSEGGHG